MDSFRYELEREARKAQADPRALGRVQTRASRLRRTHRLISAAVALAIGSAGIGLSYAAFSGSDRERPAAGPTPSSTASTKPSFRIDNHSGSKQLPYKVSFVVGHMFDASGFSGEPVPVRELTEIRYRAEGEEGARLLERRLLPGAPVREGVPAGMNVEQPRGGADVVLVLGTDYADYPLATAVRAFELAERFAARRQAGQGAEELLSPDAASQYERHQGGLQLYTYWPEGQSFYPTGPLDLPDSWVTGPDKPNLIFGVRIKVVQKPPRLEDPDDNSSFFSFQEMIEENVSLELQDDGSFLVVDAQVVPTPTPSQSPTPASEATPSPISMLLWNTPEADSALPYAIEWVDALGPAAHHGGYDVDSEMVQNDAPHPVTTIRFEPGYEAEADRLERLMFPGAQLESLEATSSHPLHVVLGRDFVERHVDALAAFEVVTSFGNARIEESRSAKRFMTEAAARYYDEDKYASLFEYAAGNTYDVGITGSGGSPRHGKSGWEFDLTFYETAADFASERVRVDEVDGELKIVEVSFFLSGSS